MSNVPTNLIPTRVTGLPEYLGSSTLGYLPYIIDGRSYKVQFANIAAVGAVPSSREINTGSGLGGGGDLSANRTLYILPGGVDDSRLSVTGVTAGTYGAVDSIPVFTVNAQGRVTGVTDTPIVLSNYVPTSRTITAGAGLTGGGDLSANRSFAVNFSSTTPEPLGPGSSGVSTVAAREDHVHPAVDLSDTTETQGVLPLSRGGTGNSLSPVAGAIVYSSNDKMYLTTAGSVGQVLRSGGPGGVPFWTEVGAGTVISVAVATANGFAGTVVSPTLSPIITLSTTVSGLLKGNGTELSAATAGIDYVEPGAYTASGLTLASARLLGRITASVGAAEEISVGNGLTLSGSSLVNAAPDQVVALTGGTAISVTGSYPSFTVTNTAPDQVVSLTGAGTTTVTGTYPSFTITSNDSTSGTVTSVNASGGTTGMSFTGGPVTSAGTLTLNGTLAIANGGTGATDAVAALTNLGAYPASNPSGFTSNVGTVTSVSGTGTVSGLSLSGTVTSAGSLTLGGTLAVLPSNFASQTANTVLAAPNGSAGVPTFRAIVAADIPTLNQNTTGTASNVTGIVAVANGGTGASVAATARTNLGAAASGANTDITSIALTTGTISTSPVNGTDIVNKAYADSIASGINFHQSVRLATAAALPANTYNNGTSGVGATLTANANGALTVDGVAAVAGNRILVKNEATQANNGVYTVTQVGNGSTPYILTRATDFDSSGSGVDQIDAGDFFLVTAGSTLANTSWVQQTPLPITVGTTAIVFSQFAAPVLYSAGTGLSLTGTTFSITNTGVSASTYGSASSVPVIAVNAQGQLTSASSSTIAIAASQITSGALAIANGGTGATSAATALTNLGAYPASNPSGFTSNTGTVTSVNLTAGTGVSVSGGPITASGSITVTNTAPDQVVSLTGSGATTVTGTYPNFTISSPTSGAGTVTSINVSGGTTGLTTSGGPVTTSGTITLAGTLNVANGGTGATTLSSGYVLKGNGTSAVSASVIYDDGTNAMIGTTTALGRLTIQGNTNANLDAWIRNDNAGSSSRAGLVLNASGNSWRMGMGSTANNSNALTWNVDIGGANTEYMRLTTGGNFAVGGTTTTARLTSQVNSGNYILDLINGSEAPFALRTYNHGSGSAPGLVFTQGLYYNTTENASIKFYRGGGATGGYLGFTVSDGTERLSINNSGNVTANVDFRAPIFYDSNNTAFYADMAGTSNFNQINLGDSTKFIRGGGSGQTILGVGSVNDAYLQVGGSYYSIWNAGNFTPGNYLPLTGGTLTGTLTIQTSGDAQLYLNGNGTSWAGIQWTDVSGSDNMWYNGSTSTFAIGGGGSFVANKKLHINGATSIGSSLALTAVATNGLLVETQVSAPIYYDSDNTSYYVDPNNTSVLNNVLTVGAVSNNVGGLRNVNPGGGSYVTSTSTVSGAIKIKLPETSYPMLRFTVRVFTYDGLSFDIYCGGHTSSALWYNTFAYMTTQNRPALNVRFTGDGTNMYVIIGELAQTWTYPQVFITDVQVGYTNYDASRWDDGWVISFETSTYHTVGSTHQVFPPTSSTNNVNPAYASIYYDSANTGYYIDPASTSNVNALNAAGNVLVAGGLGVYDVAAGNDPYGKISVTRPGDGNNYSYYGLTRAGQLGAGFGIDTINRFWWGSATAGYNGVASAIGMTMSMGGTLSVTADVRAPIFYDSNNTAFYLDPAGGSLLSSIYTDTVNSATAGDPLELCYARGSEVLVGPGGGNLPITAASYKRYAAGTGYLNGNYSSVETGATTGPIYCISSGYAPSATGLSSMYGIGYTVGSSSGVYPSDGGWGLYVAAGGVARVFLSGDSGTVWANGSVRAPIFYDSDNTAYYVNPNAGSNVLGDFRVNQNGAAGIQLLSTTGTQSLWIRTGYDGAPTPSVSATNVQFQSSGSSAGTFTFWSGNTLALSIGGDSATGAGSLRAPIFYDSQNTSYYVDPTGSTSLRTVGDWRSNSGDWTGEFNGKIQYHANNWYFQGAGSWEFRRSDSANAFSVTQAGVAIALGDMRAPVFYDNNNTGYYFDGSATSRWTTSNQDGYHTFNNYGLGIVGLYASTRFQCVYAMGDAYKGNADGTSLSGAYGLWWSYPSAGGPAATLASHGLMCIVNGSNVAQLDISTRAIGDMRAPIFYDLDNTAYYTDPAATSVLNTVQFGSNPGSGGGGGRIIPSTGSPYSIRQEFGSDNSGWRYGIAKNVGGAVTIMFYVQDNGDCVATGNVTAYSDVRIKANIKTIPSALDKLDQIRGVTYTRTDMDDKERRYAGVIAQEIEAVLPEAVGGDEDIKTVDYNATIALLIQAVKELTDKVKALEAKEQ